MCLTVNPMDECARSTVNLSAAVLVAANAATTARAARAARNVLKRILTSCQNRIGCSFQSRELFTKYFAPPSIFQANSSRRRGARAKLPSAPAPELVEDPSVHRGEGVPFRFLEKDPLVIRRPVERDFSPLVSAF